MWRTLLLAAASLLGALVSATTGLIPAGIPTAAAAPLAGCTTTTGVVVVVDFSSWGQSASRACAGTVTPETTGYTALTEAGFTPVGDLQDGPAFVCRIDGYPTQAQDPCTTTPPATAYWSYWYAPVGQDTWSYSQFGAMSFHPAPGSVNAWSFGAGTRPTFAPSAVWATTVGPSGGGSTTTTTPSTGPVSSAATTTAAGARPIGATGAADPPAGAGQSSAPAVAGSAAPGSTPSATPSTPPTPSPSNPTHPTESAGAERSPHATTTTRPGTVPRVVDAAPVSARDASSNGSPLPLVVGAVVIAVLMGSGALIAQRRRRTG